MFKLRKLTIYLVVVFMTLSLTVVANSQEGKPSKATRKALSSAEKYLEEVKGHLLKSYIDGDKLDGTELSRVAARAMADVIVEKKLKDKGDVKKKLVKELRSAKLDSIADAVKILRKYGAHLRASDVNELADAGARAMVKSTNDPFSTIIEGKDIQKLLDILFGGHDESIGIAAVPENDTFKVAYVRYDYVAYDAGILMGDELLEINGQPVKGMHIQKVQEMLTAKPGAEITLKIMREGWLRPYTFRLIQKVNKPKRVRYGLLPGGQIGYLRMTIFDLKLASSVEKALRKFEKHGIKGLILDLRDNPGGALPTSVSVADKFLEGGKLIAKTVSKYKVPFFDIGGDQTFTSTDDDDHPTYPIVLLVNRASASASELVAGALKDHNKAILIGETTYGKGAGQTAIPLMSRLLSRFLYLTVMRLYQPSGKCIDGIGVEPHILVKIPQPTGETFDKIWKLRESGALEKYIDEYYPKHKELLTELANYDGFETSAYPNFDNWYNSLKTDLSKDEVRNELRRALRNRISREHKKSFLYDLQTDTQLQRAVSEMSDMIGLDIK